MDGNDVLAVAQTMTGLRRAAAARAAVRVLLEAETYRWHGHYEGGDPERYRPAEEVAAAKEARPAADRPPPARHGGGRRRGRGDRQGDRGRDRLGEEPAGTRPPRPCTTTSPRPALPVAEPAPLPAGRRDLRPLHGRRDAWPWSTNSPPIQSVFVAGIDVGAGGNVSRTDPRTRPGLPRPGAGHAGSVRAPSSVRRWGRPVGRDEAGRSRSCAWTSSASAPRHAPQPGRQTPLHDRRPGLHALVVRTQFGAGRSSGQPALAEPGGTARAHPRPRRW
ncbi:thiamine pyrophosphate-dependent enzyme [Streptomyces sp. L7]